MPYSTFDLLALRGAEALAFAQAQLASDAAALQDGQWRWSAYLTPQGRTIALMVLVRHAPDALDLLVPAARGAELAARLQRFVFRAKVSIAVDAGRALRAVVHAQDARGDAIEVRPGGYAARLSGTVSLEPGASAGPGDEAGLLAWLVEAGVPLLAGAAVEAHTPHALGLDALGAISTTKGCYPGQEIVARTHFLGRNKRHLCRFAGPAAAAAPAPGAVIEAGGNPAAEVVLALNVADGTVRGLAVAHEQALTGIDAFRLDGNEVVLERVR